MARLMETASLLGCAALLSLSCVGCGPIAGERTSVVLITVDTLRADHVGVFGAEAGRTPALDRFARDATAYENAVAVMPVTRPSHFSMLTGLYPREHGVLNNRTSLADHHETVAEIFAAEGYRTGAFVGVSLLDRGSGADQGFEVVKGPLGVRQRSADRVVGEALDWVRGLSPGEPFFLWVHVFDPHLPYDHVDPTAADADDSPLRESLPSVDWEVLYDVAQKNGGDIPREVLAHARALYRNDVHYTDRWLGRLIEGLDELHAPETMALVLTADHGECFERGVYFEHTDCLLDAAIRVPLLVRYPGQFPAGERRRSQVSGVDIAPTLLRAAGIGPPPGISGVALQDLVEGDERYVLTEAPFYQPDVARKRIQQRRQIRSVAGDVMALPVLDHEQVALVGPRFKLVRKRKREGEFETLYTSEPAPDTPLPISNPERARLAAKLDEQLRAHPLELVEPGMINAEMLETLRALGYFE